MMPVPEYQLLLFLSWLDDRDIRFFNRSEACERLVGYAMEFLRTQGESLDSSLIGLMAIFQACPMIHEETVDQQMAHFAQCGGCLEFIDEWGKRWFDTSFDRDQSYPWPIVATSESALHPLLRGFVQRSRGSGLEWHLHHLDADSGEDWLRYFITRFGPELRGYFEIYLKDVRSSAPERIESYERWRQNRDKQGGAFVRESVDDIDANAVPLGMDESVKDAAQRLAASAAGALEDGIYDDTNMSGPQIAGLFRLTDDATN